MLPNLNQASPAEIWEAFWNLGQAICHEIEYERPDLIVVLHGSGAVVWHAVEQLWRQTHTQPLPPAIAVHIGQHSPGEYWNMYEPNEWEYMGEEPVGHMVAWMARKDTWRNALAIQVQTVMGATQPTSVLIVDDVVADGWTALTAFGVLWSVFPHAQVRLWAGVPGYWREILGVAWINTCYPEIMSQMQQGWQKDKAELFAQARWREFNFHWSSLSSGLTGGDQETLSSRPIEEAFPLADYLTRYMAAKQWLEFPRWIYGELDTNIAQWTTGAVAPPVLAPKASWRPRVYALKTEELAWTQAWFQRWSTLEEFVQCCHLALPAMAELLQKWVTSGEFSCRIVQGVAKYGRKPRGGILVYDPRLAHPTDPFWEDVCDQEAVTTPFAVEFARSEPSQAGAPVLVPVPDDQGMPVRATVLILDINGDAENAEDQIFASTLDARSPYMSYRIALRNGSKVSKIELLRDFADMAAVAYLCDGPNLDIILDPRMPDIAKAEQLAVLAVGSLTPETFIQGRDGIQYLIDTMATGLETRLTLYYRDALLRLAGDAPDLVTARQRIGERKGLV